MRLILLTQKIDVNDPVLGFFHEWVKRLSPNFEKIHVICLEKGEFNLPSNVEVYSLGKVASSATRQGGGNKIKYLFNFFRFVFCSFLKYDVVFVHMNQEYVLLGGLFWKILGKKIYFWRNHKYGNLLTKISIWLSDKVLYTSSGSFTANFESKAIKMPVGIDTEKFKDKNIERRKNSILSLGRISPVKNVNKILEAARKLSEMRVDFTLDIVGDPVNPEDVEYKNRLVEENKDMIGSGVLSFHPAIPNYQTPEIYNQHEIFINLTPYGSFDKTILESAACGCIPFNYDDKIGNQFGGVIIPDLDPLKNAYRLNGWFDILEERKDDMRKQLRKFVVENHSLNALIEKLCTVIKK